MLRLIVALSLVVCLIGSCASNPSRPDIYQTDEGDEICSTPAGCGILVARFINEVEKTEDDRIKINTIALKVVFEFESGKTRALVKQQILTMALALEREASRLLERDVFVSVTDASDHKTSTDVSCYLTMVQLDINMFVVTVDLFGIPSKSRLMKRLYYRELYSKSENGNDLVFVMPEVELAPRPPDEATKCVE